MIDIKWRMIDIIMRLVGHYKNLKYIFNSFIFSEISGLILNLNNCGSAKIRNTTLKLLISIFFLTTKSRDKLS